LQFQQVQQVLQEHKDSKVLLDKEDLTHILE
jgi:hypothetical protein